jgi:large subunit ribosomal protein L7/L12
MKEFTASTRSAQKTKKGADTHLLCGRKSGGLCPGVACKQQATLPHSGHSLCEGDAEQGGQNQKLMKREKENFGILSMSTVNEIIEKLKTLTLLEASELVSQIEETFGVDASAPVGGGVMMAAMPSFGAAEAAPKEEEKTLFDVVLEEIPADKKVGVYKVVRNIANIAVNQVKDFTGTLPKTLKESVSKEEAEAAKQQLEEVGAKVKIV